MGVRVHLTPEQIIGSHRTIAKLRETYWPGAQPHWIPVLKVGEREGTYLDGTLAEIDGMIATVRLSDGTNRQLGTLWPDRLIKVAQAEVQRDRSGRPKVGWNRSVNLLRLYDRRPPHGRPYFNVADLDDEPEYLEAWRQLAAVTGVPWDPISWRPTRRRRPLTDDP